MAIRNGMMAGLLMLVLAGAAAVDARDLLFLGLVDSKGASVQPELERALRHEFTVNTAFGLLGELETQRIVREIDKQGRTRMESWLPSGAGIADSVIVVRGIVEENTMVVGRHRLAWGKINARLTLKLYFDEVAAGGVSYHGQFGAQASKSKDFILFQNPQKTVHISAIDRSELLGKMHAGIVKDVSEFIIRWGRTLAAEKDKQEEKPAEVEPTEELAEESAEEAGATIETITVPTEE